jgi:hypothetical protein
MIFNIFAFLVAIVSALSGFFMIFGSKPTNKISKSAQHFVDAQRNTSYFDGSE